MELFTKVKPHCPFLMPETEVNQTNFNNFCNLNLGVAPNRVTKDILLWLDEDHGAGDPTLFAAQAKNQTANFYIVAKQDFILTGLPVMCETFRLASGGELKLFSDFKEGDQIKKGDVLLGGKGNAAAILLGERVALNLCAKLSGITTKTSSILTEIRKYSPSIYLLETRKTTPGLRIYEKYATRNGGARNHRHGLDSGSMLKENHLRYFGSIEYALDCVSNKTPVLNKIEIEVTNLVEFRAALNKGADVIMLDNFSLEDVHQAVKERNNFNKNTKLELSGNLDEKNIKQISSSGVDYLSMGALIHKAIWIDISLQLYMQD
ncbi:carboxylating nicotinate-nucleotide diphosphorylase [Pigmentibacter sp. JX0631]|uniref:carboxylating nicotinate-nucleotide diphosphorylase n=1 Tax=Pigmentibacter sp. JX0631 TaxID=2976982 RepID=UPI00246924A7|nr:carboxylating nicotinate-nucleotide diphosphorylase [Pigmentibacter sp. JX0631]WGL61181.1 carboxylating nicotinate-nucleotide diphosphorylase [Pigmentibacter sp. JX0631]